MDKMSTLDNVPSQEQFIAGPYLLDSAADRIIVAYYLRIRFLNLASHITYPQAIDTLLEKVYHSERLLAVKKQALAMYDIFKSTAEGLGQLDGLNCESKWMECHTKAMAKFDSGVELLEVFETEADNLAVEWECAMMFPLPKVEVGDPFPGIEDRKDHERDGEGQREQKQP